MTENEPARLLVTIDLALAVGADPESAAEAVFDLLAAAEDDELPGVDTVDSYDFKVPR